MARPQKNNADYYPHENGLRNHRKIKMLRNKFGVILGYAFWCMMLEWLCDHDGLEWEFSDFEIEMFAAELGVTAEEISTMVIFCIKIELLFKSDDNFIYSESLNENLKPVFEKRNTERQKSKSRQRKSDGTFKNTKKSSDGGVSAAEMPHSKVEYSKVYIIPKGIVGLDEPTPTVCTDPDTTNLPKESKSQSISKRCGKFIDHFNKIRGGTKFQNTESIQRKLSARLKNYSPEDILIALSNCMKDQFHKENSFRYVTPEYVLRENTMEKFLNVTNTAITATESTSVVTINHSHRE